LINKTGARKTTFATQNAPAIVYPYLRQGASFFTMQAGLPVITLPVVMMKKQNHN